MAYDVQQLLNFATGIVGDWEQNNSIAKWLFPEVPVMTEKFFYKNYGVGNAFKTFDTRRAIGGSAQRLSFTETDSMGVLIENSLEAVIDDIEKRQNSETFDQLQMVKIRDLTLTIMNNYLKFIMAFWKANTSITAEVSGGFANWSNSAVDPIIDIDNQCQAIINGTGYQPNKLYLDFSSWLLMKNNPNVLNRVRYVEKAAATLDDIKALTALPLDIRIGGGNLYETQAASGPAYSDVLLFYSQDDPGQMDASFAKTFVRTPNRFTAMRQYREEKIRSDVYYLDWQQLPVITGTAIYSRWQAQ